MALRRPYAGICITKKVGLTVLAAYTVSGVWPLAAKACSSVTELRRQRAEAAEKRAKAAEKWAEVAEQQAKAAEQQAKAAEQRAAAAEQRAAAAEQRAAAAEQRAKAAEQQAKAAEQQAKNRFWVGTALSCVTLFIVAGVITGFLPPFISQSRKLLLSGAEVIKQALHR